MSAFDNFDKEDRNLELTKSEVTLFLASFSDIDECSSSPCQNGGTCNNEVNKYTCSCVMGFDGIQCGKSELLFGIL